MGCSTFSFQQLSFPTLFSDYIAGKKSTLKYFNGHPFSDSDIKNRIENFKFSGDRNRTADILRDFNTTFDASEETLNSIEKLRKNSSLAVVTGQQLTIYGGPLFTIYKLLSAIVYAHRLEKEYSVHIVPVFWLADEDHDFEEAATIGFPEYDNFKEFSLPNPGTGDEAVGLLKLDEAFHAFRKEFKDSLIETDFSENLWNTLDECYKPGVTLREAFGKLLLKLFGKYGLVLAGSNDAVIKKETVRGLVSSVTHSETLYNALSNRSAQLINDGYHAQVQVQPSNLFYFNESGKRVKIGVEGNQWIIDGTKKSWSSRELIAEIEHKPDQFSPNVFLRPILQDLLLPSIAYVAGPGETAYYAQMKDFYQQLNMKMPLILPRFSVTLVESGIDRILDKLPFNFQDYHDRIEDLESRFIQGAESIDVEQIFTDWKNRVASISEKMKKQIVEIDPTLEGSAGKANATFFTELDKLKGKTYRAIKQQEKTQLNRIRKIKNSLFPNRNYQEREIAFVYIMNKYGTDIWDTIYRELEHEIPDNHKQICLS